MKQYIKFFLIFLTVTTLFSALVFQDFELSARYVGEKIIVAALTAAIFIPISKAVSRATARNKK